MQENSECDVDAALFRDDSGTLVGLDEVQLLENPSCHRIAVLHSALQSQDLEVRYRAALVLTAWGDEKGLDEIERLVDLRIDREGIVIPQRIDGYNNIYDEFAYAVYLFGEAEHCRAKRHKIYKKLLELYGSHDFESKLKYSLLQTEFRELLPDVKQAYRRALAIGKVYLASQLLPVLAKWDSEVAFALICQLQQNLMETPNPIVNVAEALKFIKTESGFAMLQQLTNHPDSVVADEARQVLGMNI